MIARVRQKVPGAKIIGFRAARELAHPLRRRRAGRCVGLDWMIDRDFARDHIQSRRPVQGNLDPLALVAGGAALDAAVDAVLAAFAAKPFIFNLGHGIVPETPIAHVERMLARVRGGAAPRGGATPRAGGAP